MKLMLAVEAPAEIGFPMYASPKIDGIRAVIKGGVISRSLKPIPNKFIQSQLSFACLEGLDGELIVGEPFAHNAMQSTSSGVMSREGEPAFTYYVFDYWNGPKDTPYSERYVLLRRHVEALDWFSHTTRIVVLEQVLVNNSNELKDFEESCLRQGYEGVILRKPSGIYKFGRSTVRESYLLKVKRFADSEARILSVEELLHNGNESTTDERGYAKRSSHQANKVPMNTLGALLVEDVHTGQRFGIGTGYTAEQREQLWSQREQLIGKLVKYKYFEVGSKDAPRFPVFLGFRSVLDIS